MPVGYVCPELVQPVSGAIRSRVWQRDVMRRRPTLIAAFAVAVVVLGQLAATIHAAEVRHVVCAEHGEQLEAPTLRGTVDRDAPPHVIELTGGPTEHADCAIARVLRQSSDAPHSLPVIGVAPTGVSTEIAPPRAISVAVDLVLIAPKTSPPHAS